MKKSKTKWRAGILWCSWKKLQQSTSLSLRFLWTLFWSFVVVSEFLFSSGISDLVLTAVPLRISIWFVFVPLCMAWIQVIDWYRSMAQQTHYADPFICLLTHFHLLWESTEKQKPYKFSDIYWTIKHMIYLKIQSFVSKSTSAPAILWLHETIQSI